MQIWKIKMIINTCFGVKKTLFFTVQTFTTEWTLLFSGFQEVTECRGAVQNPDFIQSKAKTYEVSSGLSINFH